ncbi:MAG: hypothetical protein JW850_02905 [Thermoflexales bacterium]|nr:hypothetical protein [Thermoflexales bacterium]
MAEQLHAPSSARSEGGGDQSPIVIESSPVPLTAAPSRPAVEIVPTWYELRGAWRVFEMSEWIMRDRVGFFEQVRHGHGLESKLRSMVVSTIIYVALYGLVMGISSGWQQALSSAVKLPMLFLVTLLICLPTLYFFNLLYGSQLTFAQTTALIMAALTITGALALAFASITLFFFLTVGEQYTLLVLLNAGVLAISSWWGLTFLRQGMHYVQGETPAKQGRILTVWLLIYGLVGTQMGWALRPFFRAPWEPFVVMRGGGGTFYGSVMTAIGWLIPKLLQRLLGG